MHILIALFQQHRDRNWREFWTIEEVGPTVPVAYDTWPKYHDTGDSQSGPDMPAAIGVVVLTCVDEVWRAECGHPDGGEPVVAGGQPTREAALDDLRRAVRERRQ
jgi:hypothetical protein